MTARTPLFWIVGAIGSLLLGASPAAPPPSGAPPVALDMQDLMALAHDPSAEHRLAGPLMMHHTMAETDRLMRTAAPEGGYRTSADAHATMQGALLAADRGESVGPGTRCPASAPVRTFHVTAISIEITLNRFLQYYPGYMYVLTENLSKARSEEQRNREAREQEDDAGAVTTGLSGDVIEPLVLRANQGDCVVITLANQIESDEAVGLHIHGSSLTVKATGAPATGGNPDAVVDAKKSQVFEWFIRPDEQEGVHMFHSHVGRDQSALGMFGAFIVEPKGSRYLAPYTAKEMKSGWQAMIVDPNGPDFREVTVIYHEVGDEAFRPLEKNGDQMPQRDILVDVYRPGSRALNYRSEPHGTRLALAKQTWGFADESQGYGSYMFGDPATPVPRSYLGDPIKWRLVHGGSEILHSHHLHGGADRWPRQPDASEKNFAKAANGPVKFPTVRVASDRIDVQTLGPSETFDEVVECGSGGCQHTAGEFLYHCHIQQHYLSGMWAFWRVYNTLQTAGAQTDTMPPLAELPDRAGRMKAGVDSSHLVGTTVDWFGKAFRLTADRTDWNASPAPVSIKDWVEMMLPPQGRPGKADDEKGQTLSYDATVLDWTWEGQRALNERETAQAWPNYRSPTPGQRVPFLFDPKTGKLAWPHLRPHLGRRPPFAPNHGPAPFLEPIHRNPDGSRSTAPPKPGEQGPWSLCPENAPRKFFTVHGIALPLTLKKATAKTPPVMDPEGQLFVLHEEEAAIRKDVDKQWPLVIRMNVGDCADVIYKSEVPDITGNHFTSKTNMHPHLFQFDTQATDGVISGMSYEQSVRPFTMLEVQQHEGGLLRPMNTQVTKPARAGESAITVDDVSHYHVNTELGIGMDNVRTFEIRRIKSIHDNVITFTEPLQFDHKPKELISVEFLRYRWYADVDLGIIYWHDHVFGHWGHGFFGSTVVEPKGSTYHDPTTGAEVRSGPIVDVHTQEPVSTQVTGSFREMIMHIMDSAFFASNKIPGVKSVQGSGSITFAPNMRTSAIPTLNGGEMTSGSGYGTRIEPLNVRLLNLRDPAMLFSSRPHGDPGTPLLRAYLGDPLVVRGLVTSTNEAHTWHVSGHWFPLERYGERAIPRNTVHISIAERYDMVIPAAGGPQRKPGDYPYYSGRASHFAEGSWGLIRVFGKSNKALKPLPGRETIPAAADSVCPAEAPVKTFKVAAMPQALHLNKQAGDAIEVDFERKLQLDNPKGKIFVLEGRPKHTTTAEATPSPLVLHVNVGDCLKITLRNKTREKVSFHADGLAYDPLDSLGINAGRNTGDQTVAPGKVKTYTFYAHPEWGEGAALIQDWGNVLEGPRNGLYGAIVIGPRGSTYRDPVTGEDLSLAASWRADVIVDPSVSGNEGRMNYRDFTLLFQDEDNIIGTNLMPYLQKVAGLAAVNYALEPHSWREEEGCDFERLLACEALNTTATPTLLAHAGDPVTIRVLGAFNEQVQVFALDGHEWPLEPLMRGADHISSHSFGGSEVINAVLNGGAGGPQNIPGTYLWMNHRLPYMEAGQWGYFRVLPRDDSTIKPLHGAPSRTATGGGAP